MSDQASPPLATSNKLEKSDSKSKDAEKTESPQNSMDEDVHIAEGQDILALQGVDPALNAKMYLVNNVR